MQRYAYRRAVAKDVLYGIEQHLKALNALSDIDDSLEVFNVSLSRFLSYINLSYLDSELSEIKRINLLFSKIDRQGRKKAKQLGLKYNSPQARIRKLNGKDKYIITLLGARSMQQAPKQASKENQPAVQKQDISEFKMMQRPAPAEEKSTLLRRSVSTAKKLLYTCTFMAVSFVGIYTGEAVYTGVPVVPVYTQLGIEFKNNTNALHYQVAAKKQQGVSNAAYELNGRTENGDWYQTGLNYRFGKFTMFYCIMNNKDVLVRKGLIPFSGNVAENDKVNLSLSINNGKVDMSAEDINTGAASRASFMGKGNTFVANGTSRFTGIMTETVSYPGFKPSNLVEQTYKNLSEKPVSYKLAFEDMAVHFVLAGKDVPFNFSFNPSFKDYSSAVKTSAPAEFAQNGTYIVLNPNFVITSGAVR
jgi:hypothetical protein